jgi:hypothetical protein
LLPAKVWIFLHSEFAKEKDRVESRAGFLLLKEEQKLEKEMNGYMNWICKAGVTHSLPFSPPHPLPLSYSSARIISIDEKGYRWAKVLSSFCTCFFRPF